MKPEVVLIAPPIYDFALFDLFLKPYSLLSIGRAFEKSGYRVSLINSLDYTEPESVKQLKKPRRYKNGTGKFFRQPAEKPALFRHIKRTYARYGIIGKVLEERIAKGKPDLVLVSTGMTYWYPGVREAVGYVRKHHRNTPVITGGIYATLCPGHCGETTGADAVICGDAFPGLLPVLEKRSLPPVCPNDDTDLLIMGDIYADAGVIRLNRGCPFRCRYCASHALSGRFKKGNARQLYSLVNTIYRRIGTTHFAFYDDALLPHKEEVFLPFLDMVINSGIPFSFSLPNGIHLDFIDIDTARLMKRAGFREVRIGLESGSKQFHDSMDNKLEISHCEEKINILIKAGFKRSDIGLYILAGLPGQYKEEAADSVHFASRFGAKIYIAEYSPVPGSPLWEESISHSSYPLESEPLTHNNTILPMEWGHFTMSDMEDIKALARSLSPPKAV